MEEILYGIEIQREKDKYLGKIYTEIGVLKEFKSHKIELLLRDIAYDMRLEFEDLKSKNIGFDKNQSS